MGRIIAVTGHRDISPGDVDLIEQVMADVVVNLWAHGHGPFVGALAWGAAAAWGQYHAIREFYRPPVPALVLGTLAMPWLFAYDLLGLAAVGLLIQWGYGHTCRDQRVEP